MQVNLPYLTNPKFHFPLNQYSLINVGATVENDYRKELNDGTDEPLWGSCYGGDGRSLDLSAPGIHIPTTDITGSGGYTQDNYYLLFNGTSAAAPLLSGLIGLLLSANPSLDYNDIYNILTSSADKVTGMGGQNYHPEYGYGRVDAFQPTLIAAAYVNKSSLQTATGYNNGRRLIKDGLGNYHLVFSSGGEIFYHKTTDGGSTWQTPIKLSYVEGNNNYPSISQSGNRIYVTWQRNLGSNNYDIYFSESTNGGLSWGTKYVLGSETVSADPLPVIHSVSNYTLIVFRANSGIKSYWTYYDVPDQYSWIMRTVGFNTSNSPTITHAINSPVTYFPLAIANSSDNHIYYYYFDTYSTQWAGGPLNLSVIVPGTAVHLTPTITNIPGNPQIHVAWKKLI